MTHDVPSPAPAESAVVASLRRVAIASFFALVASVCWFEIVDWDFWWHLATGKWIVSTRSIPTHDMFSYVAEGRPWVDSHWLFQILLYGAYAVLGIPNLILLRLPIVGLTFVLLFLTVYRKEYFWISIAVCTLALLVSLQRFLLRPEIFSLMFLAAFFYFAENFSKHPRTSIAMIAVCQLVWTNMHGLHAMGIGFLAAYLAGDLLQDWLRRIGIGIPATGVTAREWRAKAILVMVTGLMILLNANGRAGILYPTTVYSELQSKPGIFSQLGELASPFAGPWPEFPSAQSFYLLFVGVSCAALLLQWRRVRLAHVLPYLAFLYLSTLALRNMSLFAVVAVPVTIRNLYGIADSAGSFHVRSKHAIGSFALPALVLLSMIGSIVCVQNDRLYQSMGLLRRFGTGVSDWFPRQAVEYLERRGIQGRIFNNPEIGGYLIWQLYPRHQVALDGRWEVYGDPELVRRLNDPRHFEPFLSTYRVEAILLHKDSTQLRSLGPWLRRQRNWRKVLETRNAVVFERTSLEHGGADAFALPRVALRGGSCGTGRSEERVAGPATATPSFPAATARECATR